MSVTVQTPVNSYTANGVTTVFNFTFLLLSAADLDVYIDGVLKTLTADYSISGLEIDSGGAVTFLSAPANGASVVLQRNSDIARATDYQENGDLRAETLDKDFDKLWLALQELIYKYQLAPSLLPGSPLAGSITLPDPIAGLYLRWNAIANNLENANPGFYDGTILPDGAVINTFADFAILEAEINKVYYLKQNTSNGVGGGNFIGVASGGLIPDEGSISATGTPGVYVKKCDDFSYFDSIGNLVTAADVTQSIRDTRYFNTSEDFSGLVQTHGKKVVITGDSLSYNNYGFGFPYAATAQECNAGLRSWGFMLRDAIHMSDPCFAYGDTIPFHISNPLHVAVAVNNTGSYILPFNNRSLRVVASNAAGIITLTVNSFNIVNKQVVMHLAHSPGQPCAFDVYYNDNSGGADIFVQNVVVGNGVDHNGFEPFAITVPVNTLDGAARIIFKNFTDDDLSPLSASGAFYVLAAGSKLTNVYTTGVGGTNAEYFVTNYAAKIGAHAPDLLIMCLGANDRLNYTLARHLAALTTIFTNARASNPYVRIILITSPPALESGGNIGYYPDTATNSADPGLTMREWVAGVEQLCREQGVIFYNQYRFLYDLNPDYLFVDGIHLTRNAGRDVFRSLMDSYFSKCGAPTEHLHGYATYSVIGSGDLMGRQIAAMENTKASVKVAGQFKITYTHGTTSWSISDKVERGTNRPVAPKSAVISGSAHTTLLEFYIPVFEAAYGEYYSPLNVTAEFLGGVTVNVTLSVKPLTTNVCIMTIRDNTGALIDPATINGAIFLIKYQSI